MDASGCERNWAKRIPHGTEDDTCFGLTQADYIPFWCMVAAVTLAAYVIPHFVRKDQTRPKPAFFQSPLCRTLLQRCARRAKVRQPELEEGLLQAESGHAQAGVRIAAGLVARLCQDCFGQWDIDTIVLGALLVLQNRRRYGGVTVAVQSTSGKASMVALELADPPAKTPFATVLKDTAAALNACQSAADSAEVAGVRLQWGAKGPQAGQWTACRTEEGALQVHGPSGAEEACFKDLLEALAGEAAEDVWASPAAAADALGQAREWGAPSSEFLQYRDPQSSKLLPVTYFASKSRLANPDADALVGDGFRLSYDDLHKRAARVAQLLGETLGSDAKGKPIVLYMGRGEMIGPAFLGIFQAGHFAVPIDAHWPLERVRTVASDSAAALALVETRTSAAWTSLGSEMPSAVVLDTAFFAEGDAVAQPQLAVIADQDDPAIILFTSGSTGKPKGIVLSHGYVTSLAAGRAESLRMDTKTRTLAYHSPTWMPFIDYFFGPLLKGGCCLFFPEGTSHAVSPSDLRGFAVKNNASIIGFVPPVLDIFVDDGIPDAVRVVCVGGAAVPADLCRRVVAALPVGEDGRRGMIATGYHGTEQGDVTQIRLSVDDDVDRYVTEKGVMSSGRPHTVQRCAVLDKALHPCGPGAIGEICVSGPGLASGYLNLPEKSAETFLESCVAFGGARTMRTSDLGVWRPSGSLEVVGRRDAMVKVRGARVELGEVESAVRAHPDVRDCVVVVNEDRLVAYIVPAIPASLRDHCKERLVAYMVPHVFEGLEELPKLANGKVNKKALPAPSAGAGAGETVMELDSLGKMRKITRASVSEDRVLDNVRAILIAVVIQSHAVPLMPTGLGMLDVASRPIAGALWGPWQYFVLSLSRSGGWPSLAFLAGFDETRSDDAFRVTYRELIFLGLWVLGGFNWSMWFLPAFVYMRVAFVAAKRFGLERTHMLIASQIWLTLPAFVDFYVGWAPVKDGDVTQCPSQCFCPFEALPWAETAAYYTIGWWNAGTSHSFVGRGLFFIPCYWLGFYCGHRVMPILTRVADEPKAAKRIAIASAMLVLYILTFTMGRSVEDNFDDRCSSLWQDGHFVWTQTLHNIAYYLANLWAAVLYVVFIAAAVPVHLKYLAKVCFLALVATAYTPCLLDLPQMAMQLRGVLPPALSPGLELAWIFSVPFLYELVAGAILASVLQVAVRLCMMDTSRCKFRKHATSMALRGASVVIALMAVAGLLHFHLAF